MAPAVVRMATKVHWADIGPDGKSIDQERLQKRSGCRAGYRSPRARPIIGRPRWAGYHDWTTTLSRQINAPSTAAMAVSFTMTEPVDNPDRLAECRRRPSALSPARRREIEKVYPVARNDLSSILTPESRRKRMSRCPHWRGIHRCGTLQFAILAVEVADVQRFEAETGGPARATSLTPLKRTGPHVFVLTGDIAANELIDTIDQHLHFAGHGHPDHGLTKKNACHLIVDNDDPRRLQEGSHVSMICPWTGLLSTLMRVKSIGFRKHVRKIKKQESR